MSECVRAVKISAVTQHQLDRTTMCPSVCTSALILSWIITFTCAHSSWMCMKSTVLYIISILVFIHALHALCCDEHARRSFPEQIVWSVCGGGVSAYHKQHESPIFIFIYMSKTRWVFYKQCRFTGWEQPQSSLDFFSAYSSKTFDWNDDLNVMVGQSVALK